MTRSNSTWLAQLLPVSALALAAACYPTPIEGSGDSGETTDGDTTSGSTTNGNTTSPSTSAAPTTDDSDSTTAGTTVDPTDNTTTDPITTTDPGPECGDGKLDPGEECDLGPMNSDNGLCTSSCALSVCGDDLTQPGSRASVVVKGAAPLAQVFLVASLAQSQTPWPIVPNELVVPALPAVLAAHIGDASPAGEFHFVVAAFGGSQSLTWICQAAGLDGTDLDMSNAVAVQIAF